jgi:hypothetical protein
VKREARRELLDARAETIALLVLGFSVGMYLLLKDEPLGALISEPVTGSDWWDAALTVAGAAIGLVFVGAIAAAVIVVPVKWLLSEREKAKERRGWREDGP